MTWNAGAQVEHGHRHSMLGSSLLSRKAFILLRNIPPRHYSHQDPTQKQLSMSVSTGLNFTCRDSSLVIKSHTIIVRHESPQTRSTIVFSACLDTSSIEVVNSLSGLGVKGEMDGAGLCSIGVRCSWRIFPQHEVGNWCRAIGRTYNEYFAVIIPRVGKS